MHKTICFINQKGGCGKSSSCFHLAGTLASMGKRVLIIDTDPQGSISQGFFGPDATHRLPESDTIAALFDMNRGRVERESLVRSTSIASVSVVSSNHHLSGFNTPMPRDTGMRQFVLREFVDGMSGWDLVLIDCPPNLYQCSWNAMIASDFVVIPVPPEDFGTQGIRIVHQAIQSASTLNPRLRLLGNLVTRMDRRLLIHRAFEAQLRGSFSESVLQAVIPELSAFKVALACRQPVYQYAPGSQAALAMQSLAMEMMGRMNAIDGRRAA